MKATVFLVLSLAFVFGRVMAAPLDEDQTMAEDENQVNSLDSNEYSQQLYEKVSSEIIVFFVEFLLFKMFISAYSFGRSRSDQEILEIPDV